MYYTVLFSRYETLLHLNYFKLREYYYHLLNFYVKLYSITVSKHVTQYKSLLLRDKGRCLLIKTSRICPGSFFKFYFILFYGVLLISWNVRTGRSSSCPTLSSKDLSLMGNYSVHGMCGLDVHLPELSCVRIIFLFF